MAGRVRVKTVKKTLANPDIQSLFGSALGGESASVDVKIAWPKFKQVRRHTARLVTLMHWLCDQAWLKEGFPAEAMNIARYTRGLSEEHAQLFVNDVPDLDAPGLTDPVTRAVYGDESDHAAHDAFTLGLDRARPEDVEKFIARYKPAVESDLVNTAVVICSNLTNYRASIEDREKLNNRFLLSPGLSFAPIPKLEAANFKAFYQGGVLGRERRDQILVFLNKLYHISHDAYEAANLPDVDVEEFVSVITQSIAQVKNSPGLERCGDAFKKLEESIGMLRGNFGKYYKDSKHSGNPGMLMESFVMDVAGSSQNSSPKVRMQFKKIIGYYQKLAANQPGDARTRALFSEIDANFAELEKREKAAGLDDIAEDATENDAGLAGSQPEDAALLESQVVETAASQAAAAEGREMTDDERAIHVKEVAKMRKKRANTRRKAGHSMDRYLERHGSASGLSDLAQELMGQFAGAAADDTTASAASAAPLGGDDTA